MLLFYKVEMPASWAVSLFVLMSTSSTVSRRISSDTEAQNIDARDTSSDNGNGNGCGCGYQLSKYGNLYLRDLLDIDFSKINSLKATGLAISHGWQIGGSAPDGTQAWADTNNVRLENGELHLVVPGGQTAGGRVSAAEVTFSNQDKGMTKMVAQAMIQVDATPGTCQSLFTFAKDKEQFGDEQDTEIIAASLLKESTVAKPGIQLTNHAPDKSGQKDYRITPFPADPSTSFHEYSISWSGQSTQYYFDGQALPGPEQYASHNPSVVILNNWATGDTAFFGAGLPSRDVIMRVRSLKVYYETDSTSQMPEGCDTSQVCIV